MAASNDGDRRGRGASSSRCSTTTTCWCPGARVRCAAAIEAEPEVDYLYSDEDKVDDAGRFYDVFEKPAWSPERLRGQMYTCHFSVLRTSLVREVGGFREGYDGSQDHDLVAPRDRAGPPRAAHPADALPLAGRPRLRRRRRPRQALRVARRARGPCRPTSTGSASTATVELGPRPGTYRIDRRLDPASPGQRGHPDPGRRGSRLGRAPLLRRRGGALAARSAAATTTSRSSSSTTPSTPPEVLDDADRRCPARLQLVPYAKALQLQREVQPGRHLVVRRRRGPAQRRHRDQLRPASWSSWWPRSSRTASG